jgi:hypothetical protein
MKETYRFIPRSAKEGSSIVRQLVDAVFDALYSLGVFTHCWYWWLAEEAERARVC